MVRFECIHCGGRISVQDRHMDRLVRCPECGGVTHPLAADLVSAREPREASEKAATPTTPPVSKLAPFSEPQSPPATLCHNCGEPIGKLQKPYDWEDHIVCRPCHHALTLEKDAKSALSRARGSPDAILPLSGEVIEARARRPRLRASEIAVTLRWACIGLCLTAVALYAIVTILKSLSMVAVWAAIAVALVVAFFWIRRSVISLRARVASSPTVRRVRSMIRD